jgi:heptosyltransferase-2
MKVALRAPNWLGDAVMALPAIRAVAASGDEPVILALPSVAAVFSEWPVIPVRRGLDVAPVRSSAAPRIILFTHSVPTALAARLAGIPERIGYQRIFGNLLLTRSWPRPRGLHQIDEYSRLVEAAGYGPCEERPRLSPPGPSSIDGDYLVLAPGARYGSAKRWPGFAALARALAGRGERVVLLGAAGEAGKDLPRSERVVDLSGRTSLIEALAITAGARAVVSNDSGLAHAARAYGRPTVVLFGPTDPTRTAARGAAVVAAEADCAPCHLRLCPIDHRCMTAITVERILEALGQ